jgi:hypothetical protein
MSVYSKIYENQMATIQNNEAVNTFKTDMFLRQLFYTTVISSFGYDGDVPEFIGPEDDYIEEGLFNWGMVGYYEENGVGYIAPCFGNGILQENGLYSSYTFIYRNGKMVIKDYKDIELCFNNLYRIPSIITVNEIVDKCLRALRTVDMLLMKAGLPSINAIGDETKVQQVIDKIKKAYDLNDPYAIVSGEWTGTEVTKVNMYDNKADDILAQWDIFVRYKNLFFTTFGVNNVEISKQERLTLAESESNTEITRYGLFYDMFEHRRSWCRRIEKHFGKKIRVFINRNVDTVTEFEMTTDEKVEMKNKIIAPYSEETKKTEEVDENVDSKVTD